MHAQLLLRTYYFTSESYLLFANEHVFTDHTLLIDQVCPSCKVGCMHAINALHLSSSYGDYYMKVFETYFLIRESIQIKLPWRCHRNHYQGSDINYFVFTVKTNGKPIP